MGVVRRVVIRCGEFLEGALVLLAAAPFLFVAALLVMVDRTGPLLYCQERYGRGKKVFRIYKFRTMRPGAESGRPVWGKEIDPRASAIGNFLRRTHLDELPQLFNVLRGEMSLVGPRPERPYFSDLFEDVIPDYAVRYEVNPGITGWAQIHGLRGDSCVEERTKYDLFYVKNQTAALNLYILMMTPFARPVKSQVTKKAGYVKSALSPSTGNVRQGVNS